MSPDDLRDIFGDDAAYSDFFSSMFERGQERSSAPRRGRDLEAAVEITLDEAFHGATRALQIGERRIEARIPPGVDTGARVRLVGQGSAAAAGGEARVTTLDALYRGGACQGQCAQLAVPDPVAGRA